MRLLIFFIILGFFQSFHSRMIAPCVYEKNNYRFNLTNIQESSPFETVDEFNEKWKYYVGICEPAGVKCGKDNNTDYKAVEIFDDDSMSYCNPIGGKGNKDVRMSIYDPWNIKQGVVLTYKNGETLAVDGSTLKRMTRIFVLCDESKNETEFRFIKQILRHNHLIYIFLLKSSKVCPKKIKKTEPKEEDYWIEYGDDFSNFTYEKLNNRVYLTGVFKSNDVFQHSKMIRQLPVGFRPKKKILYPTTVAYSMGSWNDEWMSDTMFEPRMLVIYPDGAIEIQRYPFDEKNEENEKNKNFHYKMHMIVTLDNISFRISE